MLTCVSTERQLIARVCARKTKETS